MGPAPSHPKTVSYSGSAEAWQGPRGSASLRPFHSVLSGTVRTAPTSALEVRGEAKGRVAVVQGDVGTVGDAARAGDMSGAWGHVDEARDVCAGRGGSWGAVQRGAWAWRA